MKLYIKRIQNGGIDAYALVDEWGKVLPNQMDGTLRSAAGEDPTFTVTFLAGNSGLQVIDERDD